MISGVIERFVYRARERSRRIRHLLALAADVHWELDAEARLTAAGTGSGRPVARAVLGRAPWELPQFQCDALELARLRDDLAAQRPFRDVPITWNSQHTGRREAFLVSGEPRTDAHGQFAGFWGVGRNVTQVMATRQALAVTESRYRRLFSVVPTPLALRREGGQVVICVRDDGRGSPAETLAQLGERFYRPEGTQAEGSGLGLALVRRIAEWHGGNLRLAAGPGGRGFSATVILPLRAAGTHP